MLHEPKCSCYFLESTLPLHSSPFRWWGWRCVQNDDLQKSKSPFTMFFWRSHPRCSIPKQIIKLRAANHWVCNNCDVDWWHRRSHEFLWSTNPLLLEGPPKKKLQKLFPMPKLDLADGDHWLTPKGASVWTQCHPHPERAKRTQRCKWQQHGSIAA